VTPVFCEGHADPAGLPPAMLVAEIVRVGRDAAADLTLDDGQASRIHAELEPVGGGVLVTDAGSRNGTFVNGVRIDRPRLLARAGSTIRCGKTLLWVSDDIDQFAGVWSQTQGLLVGGPRMKAVQQLVESIAPLTDPVLIEGETGTGKERVAEALHRASGRRGEYVPVNCAAIPTELVEAELFGYRRGAFSGSEGARQGLFRAADGGTLLLDEIGDLPAPAQAKLLRALEGGEVRAVGDDAVHHVDVRVIAATNLSLDELVAEGRFRVDLLHRVAAWRVRIAPLRDRREDVPLLARFFLGPAGGDFSVEAMERLMGWSWPGNVRELRNVVKAAATRALTQGAPRIGVEQLPSSVEVVDRTAPAQPAADVEDVALRARLETALLLREGNVTQVARDLGFGRPALYQALRRLGIDPETFRKR
jgi:transcriptional regulator with GAF, ATPase, and Fis domain